MRTSVIIVNFNGRKHLSYCLGGLEAQTRMPDEVIVVDNASSDGSRELVRTSYPWVRLISMSENLGFSAGNNVGIRNSTADVLILLNNDTAPSPGFIEELVRPLEDDPRLSAVSGVMLFDTEVEKVATSGIDVFDNGLALDHETGVLWRDLPLQQDVFGATGGAAAFCRTALEDVDLLPEPFFMYLEDVDLAWRLRLRNHNTVSRSAAWVHHAYSATAGEGSPFKDYHLARNRCWTLIRCWPRWMWFRFWWRVVLYEIGALGFAIATARWSSVHGRLSGWTSVRRVLRGRRIIQQRTTAEGGELLYWMRRAPSVRNIFQTRSVIRSLVGKWADH